MRVTVLLAFSVVVLLVSDLPAPAQYRQLAKPKAQKPNAQKPSAYAPAYNPIANNKITYNPNAYNQYPRSVGTSNPYAYYPNAYNAYNPNAYNAYAYNANAYNAYAYNPNSLPNVVAERMRQIEAVQDPARRALLMQMLQEEIDMRLRMLEMANGLARVGLQ